MPADEKIVWRVELREVVLPWVLPCIDSERAKVYGEGDSADAALDDLRRKLQEREAETRDRLALLTREYGARQP